MRLEFVRKKLLVFKTLAAVVPATHWLKSIFAPVYYICCFLLVVINCLELHMQIGEIKLDAPLVLAPMAGITDLPFRVICRRLGCGMTVSEMVSAKGLLYKNVKTTEMLRIDEGERPTAIQLFGSVPEELAAAAKQVEASGADIIDFNMGCPVPKIVNYGEGSALMKNPELAYEVLAAMVEAVKIPVTVKFRAGWDDEHRNAVEIALAA